MRIIFSLILTLFICIFCSAQSKEERTLPCNNWLYLPPVSPTVSYVQVGDLDISGNQMTVEAVFNRTTPFSGGDLYAGNLVSKHFDTQNCNYLLRPNSAEITTSNGYFIAQAPCGIQLNKTYHVAMTYDGATLKFYRNGHLLAQTAATGNLYQSNLRTRIGWLDENFPAEQFVGNINEVKLWNTVRTQTQLRAYMNDPLPSPTTQSGLVAYYSFNNLLNKQGNAAWNGTLIGNAAINQTNNSCNFIADSCGINVSPTDTVIINKYTPIISLDPCKNVINVENAAEFNIGDTVLMIQMKGAVIDSTNTAAFGNVTNYRSAGNYEYNYVKAKTGNSIELLNRIVRTYEIPDGKVQLVRVPYYHSVTFNSVLTAAPWDGSKGGILALNVRDTFTLNYNINLSNKGFRGGQKITHSFFICDVGDYFTSVTNGSYGALKGESIVNSNRLYGRGKFASGGGGGNSHNSGGAGGANGGNGGAGGNQYDHPNVCNSGLTNGGIGGSSLSYSSAQNKIFLGGGGGAGQDNENLSVSGGNGGGLAIVNARVFNPNQNKIISNGASPLSSNPGPAEDGKSGGGAGGTVLVNYTTLMNPLDVEAKGGNGDKTVGFGTISYVGPGGGGGGGVVWINTPTYPAQITSNLTGGVNGTNIYYSNNPWGASSGTAGQRLNNLVLPFATIPFKANIDSVRFNIVPASCRTFNFTGFGYTNTNPVISWQWYFGDGNTANTQNPTHIYSSSGTFIVKLVITDANGCKDSISNPVNTSDITAFAGNDASYCSNSAVSHQLTGTGGNTGDTYSWQPAALLNNPNIANPIATVNSTTTFYFSITTQDGCSGIDSIIINVNPIPIITTFTDTAFCSNTTLNLNASGATSYSWLPAGSVSNPNIANPVFTGLSSQTMTVTGSNGNCSSSQSFNVTVNTAPVVTTIPDSTLCGPQSIVLTTTGAQTYSWSPATGLSNPNISNPTFTGTSNASYIVTGTAANGCSATDNINITVTTPPSLVSFPDTAVCANAVLQLNATGANSYAWTPATSVSNPSIANPVFTGTSTQIVTVTGSNGPGCSQSLSFTVTVNNVPTVSTIPDSILCGPQAIVLTTTGGQSYSWSPAAGLSDPAISNPVFTGTSNASYTVTGTSAEGCSATDNINITVLTPPSLASFPDTAVCDNEVLQLNATGANSYAWTPTASVSNPSIANPVFTGNNTQTITVTGSNGPGCEQSISFIVTVNQSPTVTTIPDSTICSTQSIVLNTTGAQTYSWSPATNLSNPNIADPFFSGSIGNTYTVTGTAANGCSNTDNVLITVRTPASFNQPPDTAVCINRTVTLNANNESGLNYQWSPATGLSNTTINNPVFTPSSIGPATINLSISEPVCNSSANFQLTVMVNALPTISASRSNDIDCSIRSAALTATGALTYTWLPASTLNNPNIATPVASPQSTTLYSVTGTDNNGCVNTASVEVKVGNKEGGYYIPNAFTPNGDGLNDCFGVRHWGDVSELYFIIYNRYGEKVFETRNISECWNGYYKGKPALAGNYVYYIRSVNACSEQEKKGNVILIR